MFDTFETALKGKYTFRYNNGRSVSSLTVQELYDYDKEDLDIIYKDLIKKKRECTGESLLNVKSNDEVIIDIKLKIIAHIVENKQKEEKEKIEKINLNKKRNKDRKFLLELKDKKRQDTMSSLSLEEIDEKLRELDD